MLGYSKFHRVSTYTAGYEAHKTRISEAAKCWADRGIIRPHLMSLAAGTRLDSYEIIAPLRAGGMGEVYRARDCCVGFFLGEPAATKRKSG